MASGVGVDVVGGVDDRVGSEGVVMGVDVDAAEGVRQVGGDAVEFVEAAGHAVSAFRRDEARAGEVEQADGDDEGAALGEGRQERAQLGP